MMEINCNLVPKNELLDYLNYSNNDANDLMLDCSITETGISGYSLVQSTDMFYPLVDDPYLQGEIACANVLSDLYAVGVHTPNTMLQLISTSERMSPSAKEIVTKLMMRGFSDAAKRAGTRITGGQTIRNPWVIIGGVVSAVVPTDQIIT